MAVATAVASRTLFFLFMTEPLLLEWWGHFERCVRQRFPCTFSKMLNVFNVYDKNIENQQVRILPADLEGGAATDEASGIRVKLRCG